MSSTPPPAMQSRHPRRLDPAMVASRRVFIRCDFNVPVDDSGRVTDTARIDRSAAGIIALAGAGARVILASHFGRPKGQVVAGMSLRPILPALESALGRKVAFAEDCIGESAQKTIAAMQDGDICLLENLRFHKGEEAGDLDFAKALAAHVDLYVNDAFSCCHRAHASITGIPKLLGREKCFAGALLLEEMDYLSRALENPARPVLAIVGGAKVSTKLAVLENLIHKVDAIIIGGAMANTFLKARGIAIGKSLIEDDMLETANKIMADAESADCTMLLPESVVTAKEFRENAANRDVNLQEDKVQDDEMILDIYLSAEAENVFQKAKTLIWNGPLGAFEITPFDLATRKLARNVAMRTKNDGLISVAGGGDTAAVLNQSGAADGFSYISTAGGAFLEWIEGKTLPGIAALMD